MFQIKYTNDPAGFFAISCSAYHNIGQYNTEAVEELIADIDEMLLKSIGNKKIAQNLSLILHARHVIMGFLENAHLQNCSYVAFRFVV